MSFAPLTLVAGPAPWLPQPNVDTDVIIRIERLTTLGRAELGPYCLESLRYREDGSEDPAFVLNRPPFRGAPFLLAGENFGCGSSREGAVWALQAMGVRCVIAPSFGDIFFSNCFQNGILAIKLPQKDVDKLLDDASRGSNAKLTVDLVTQEIHGPDGGVIKFDVDAFRKHCLLNGLDNIGLTLEKEHHINQFEAGDRTKRPWA